MGGGTAGSYREASATVWIIVERLTCHAVLCRQKDRGFHWVGVVAVASTQGMGSLVADIGHRQRQGWSNGLLDAEVPGIQGGQPQRVRTRLRAYCVTRIRQQAVGGDRGKYIGERARF